MTSEDAMEKLEEMGLNRPGTLFEADGHKFLTTGGKGPEGLSVLRLEQLGREPLDIDLLYTDYQDGNLSVLATHDRDSEVAINRQMLARLADDITEDIVDGWYEGCHAEELAEAAIEAHERLDNENEVQRLRGLLEGDD